MKSIALYLILSFMISFSIQNSDTITENKKKTKTNKHTPCESKCMACQQAAYNIKFYEKPNCKKNHCKATVIKYINLYINFLVPQSPFNVESTQYCICWFQVR